MTSVNLNPEIAMAVETWLKAQVLQLSVDTLKSNAITCTACGEVLGTYIIEYGGDRFRYSLEQTYAFLKFIAAGESDRRVRDASRTIWLRHFRPQFPPPQCWSDRARL